MNNIILLIDDDHIILAIKKKQLQEIPKCKILTADNGIKGIDIAQKVSPTLILLDVIMPDMNGLEVCKKLKSNELTGHIPIIFHTANNKECDILDGLHAGAIDYVDKVCNPDIFMCSYRKSFKTSNYSKKIKKRIKS